MQGLAVCLARWFLLREGERHARDRAEFQHGRPCVQAQACACEEREGVRDTRDAQRAAQVEQAIGRGCFGADAEAAAVGGAHLHREDHLLARKLDRLGVFPLPQRRRVRERVAVVGEHVEAQRPEEASAVRAAALARLHGAQCDGGVQAEGKRLHKPGACRLSIAAYKTQVECALGAAVRELAQGVSRFVAGCHAQRACEVVARSQGQDPQAGPRRLAQPHESIDRLVDDAVAAQHKHGVVLAGLCRNLGRLVAARGEAHPPACDRSLARLQGPLDLDGPLAPAPALRRRVRYDERLAPSGFHAGCSYLFKFPIHHGQRYHGKGCRSTSCCLGLAVEGM